MADRDALWDDTLASDSLCAPKYGGMNYISETGLTLYD